MNSRILDKSIKDISPLISGVVASGGTVRLAVKGSSMKPFLVSGRDYVILTAADNLRRYDVVLYYSADGNIALHRIVDITSHGYTIIGDNQYLFDINVGTDQIISKAAYFERAGQKISECETRWFGALWHSTFCVRKVARRGKSWAKKHLAVYMNFLKNKYR